MAFINPHASGQAQEGRLDGYEGEVGSPMKDHGSCYTCFSDIFPVNTVMPQSPRGAADRAPGLPKPPAVFVLGGGGAEIPHAGTLKPTSFYLSSSCWRFFSFSVPLFLSLPKTHRNLSGNESF